MCHLVLRNLSLYLYAIDGVGLRLHGDDTYLTHADLTSLGFIAYTRQFHYYALGLAGNHKVAILIAHAAVYEGPVGNLQQGDIGKFDGLALTIDNTPHDLGCFLLSTLYEDGVFLVGDLHGIEPNDLANGFLDRKLAEVGGHGEVLQLVIDEVDGLV